MRILVVEDHADLAATVGDYLAARGHTVDFAYDGRSAYTTASEAQFDVIVLDRVMPAMDGATVCRKLRGEAGVTTPVLMLTALDTVTNRIEGLEAGADDYLVKPFAMAELEARLQALHRRASGSVVSRKLVVGDLEYDPQTREAHRAGQLVTLNPTTRKLLEFLMRQTHRVVSREELEHLLWGDDLPDGDVLRAHLHVLRAAVDRPFTHKLLHTVRGAGYRLADDGETAET
ncbi:response regulator transcription factor [Sinimarinibacterium sp. CAU 1509]|uniref:response regulator transcription factor n=1 Tax=Sinimarinibacterium sp. CAU 1509 TaxID=2562283 RepID=UPI0010AD908E|nr:response regulator transcription factor [Sinimarinibacterium sp. CAU 1509]TJY58266.1 response regulator transcription factor [Sinimarinibacterium sp. CAU 1509]